MATLHLHLSDAPAIAGTPCGTCRALIQAKQVMTEASDETRELTLRIAWLYFAEGLTQDNIAQRLGLTRLRVNRMVNEAREAGLITFALNDPLEHCLRLEKALTERFGLAEARVVPAPEDPQQTGRIVGEAAGRYVSHMLGDGETISVGWGRTINHALRTIMPRRGRGNSVVSLFGGLPIGAPISPYDIAARLGRLLDAPRHYLTAPMFVHDRETRDALLREPGIAQVLKLAASADMALVSATDLTDASKNTVFGVLPEKARTSLLKAGAAGDCCGIFLDAEGRPVTHELTQRMIAPELTDLRRIKRLVLASGAPQKTAILRACLLAGLAHVLVTDEKTALALLGGESPA